MRLLVIIVLGGLAAACSTAPPPEIQANAQPRTLRVDYFHTGSSTQELFSLDEVVVEPTPWPGRAGHTDDSLRYGAYGFDVRDAASSALSIPGASARSSTNGPRPRRRQRSHARSTSPSASRCLRIPSRSPSANASGVDHWRDVWTMTCRSEGHVRQHRRARSGPGALIAIETHGDPSTKVDLLLLGDGYTAAERSQVRNRRPAAHSDPLRDVAVQGTPQRFQRLGARARRSRVGHLASIAGHPSRLAGRCDLRRLRLGTIRTDARQQGVPSHRIVRAVRRCRDRSERPHLRRRRDLQPVQHGRRRQRVRRRTSSCTSSAITSRRWPTSTTRRPSPTCRRRRARNPGSRTSRRCSLPTH